MTNRFVALEFLGEFEANELHLEFDFAADDLHLDNHSADDFPVVDFHIDFALQIGLLGMKLTQETDDFQHPFESFCLLWFVAFGKLQVFQRQQYVGFVVAKDGALV